MWILILALTAGTLSTGDSSSMTNAEFSSKGKCEEAGEIATKEFNTVMKSTKFVCVEK